MLNIIDQPAFPHHSPDRAGDADFCTDTGNGTCPGTGEHRGAPEQERTRPRRKNPGARTKRKRDREFATNRPMSLAILAMEYIWLWDVRHGISINEIAMREGLGVRRVHYGVARARAQERSCSTEDATRPPRLIPLFPLGPLTPESVCRHNGPIEPGSLFCCVICHHSGIDDHPALKRDARTDPTPEAKPAPAPPKKTCETRRQRRRRIFGTSTFLSAS